MISALFRLLAVLAPLSAAGQASGADIERFAVIIGNDLGASGEVPLRYAEADAAKVARVLQGVGGFRPENMMLLRGNDAGTALRAIISMNERIRAWTGRGAETELLVYFSGHGDRTSLHLGPTRLDLHALEQLVRGSAATLRLLIVDSCHSGALTRVKGGRSAPPIHLDPGGRLYGEGLVFLTSSAASEAAQESDQLRSSFFTHYLTSGLLGAADSNGDGVVVLKEVYWHAYENTIRATSRTEGGVQHPTYRHEMGGQGDIVLSNLRQSPGRATVRFPRGSSFLLFEGGADGPLLAEVTSWDRARAIAVRPGPYFVRARRQDHLLEGKIHVAEGAELFIRVDALDRVDYARLVRKGLSPAAAVHGGLLGYQVRTPFLQGASPCQGPFVSYVGDLARMRVSGRLGACRSWLRLGDVSARTDEVSIGGRVGIARDAELLTLEAGASVGYTLLRQDFADERPTGHSSAFSLEAGGSLIRYLPAGHYVTAEVAALAYVYRGKALGQASNYVLSPAVRLGAAIGWQF